MHEYLNELNEIQRKAVTTTDGPVLVVAGPGSGKTRVLTYRIAHLIEKGTAPWEILALTFTNKAAREMKERISKVVGDRGSSLWAGTFHSVFCKILRVEADKIGYPRSFTIYDSQDSKSLITNIIKEMGLDPKAYNPNTVRARISSAKSNMMSPAVYRLSEDWLKEDRQKKIPDVVYIYERYAKRCRRSGAMDFDDLLFLLYQLLKDNKDGVREKYQQKFKYVLVDEFQDTNSLQYAILRLLVEYPGSPNNMCAVGDDAQSIYAFRGATIQNILDFENDFKGLQTFKLEQNYRSTEHIVQAANEVITKNKKQIQKTIWSQKGEGQKIKIIPSMNDIEEGRRVAGMIVEQKSRYHLRNNEIAILYRTNAQSRVFEESLRRQNVLYKVFGGLSFYQRKEIKDLIAYLRLSVNINDEEALRRIINYPKRGIGKTSLDKLSAAATEVGKSMWDAMNMVTVGAKTKNGFAEFQKLIRHFQNIIETKDAYEAAMYIANKSGLLGEIKTDRTIEGKGRLENIENLLSGVSNFVEGEETGTDVVAEDDKSLEAYLQSISLMTDQDSEKDEKQTVTLMSVHAAKGLEFKSVFVVGLEENLFPSLKSGQMPSEQMEAIDEERRLFYVAITRAELYLTLTFTKSRYQYGKQKQNRPSRFLSEIAIEHLESAGSLSSHVPSKSPPTARVRTGVSGNFRQPLSRAKAMSSTSIANFKASPSSSIQTGMKVLHQRFGEGKVLSIDGNEDSKVATIFFKGVSNPERKIMLRFAKLQIVS
ncbi:MAG: DNA helicase-2/ATP-dependent DNA helicase PcrA [Polaribacter sp.]|jgi:DNA helicase-2/ATP-dependent DNA helicase PcrA